MTTPFSESEKAPVGLIAGWGDFPVRVAERLKADGIPLVVAAIVGHADPRLEELADVHQWVGVAKLGRQVRLFEQNGVRQATLAGKIFKGQVLYGRGGWIRHLPDWTCVRVFGPHFLFRSQDTRDDSLLGAIVGLFESKRIKIVPATDFAPELLVTEGSLTGRWPTAAQWKDIQFGWQIAKQMGGLDIGQSVTILDRTVLAVEAVEGTDACIQRTAVLCPRGGFSLVKVAKPQQDMRFDVPTIGVQTIERLHKAGGRAIGIEADRTIVVDREEVLKVARKLKIAIVAVRESGDQVAAVRDSEKRESGEIQTSVENLSVARVA